MKLSGKYSAFPHLTIVACGQLRTAERVVIPQKRRTETLVYAQIIPLIGIREEVPRIVHKGKPCTDVGRTGVHPSPKFGLLKVASIDIIETCHRSQIEVFCQTEHKVDFHLCLKALVTAFIFVIHRIPVSYSPIQTGKRIKIKVIIQPVFIFRKDMIAPNAQQIESDSGHIAIQ